MTKTNQPLTVLLIIRDLDRSSGGPSVSIPQLSQALSEHPAVGRVVLAARPSEDPVPIPETNSLSLCWLTGENQSIDTVIAGIAKTPGMPLLVHVNGLWNSLVHATAVAVRRRGVPSIWSTRGMLEPAAYRHKRWRKLIGWWLYQRRDLLRARGLHATSPEESANLQARGLPREKIFVIPPGIHIPAASADIKERIDGDRPKTLLFLGRLHPIKGLETLLEAWARARPAGWSLQLTGPDENDYGRILRRRIAERNLGETVFLTAPIRGEAKWDLLARKADCLVLPSYSENFGLVVAEALAAGVPAAASTGTPWEGLIREKAGWRFEPVVDSITGFLNTLENTPHAELTAMGRRGRAWMERDFAWPAIVERYLEAYRVCLRGPGIHRSILDSAGDE